MLPMVISTKFISTKKSIVLGKLFFILYICSIMNQIEAQGVYFSQYYSSPLVLNPAYTGQHEDKFRIVSNTHVQGNYFNENVISGTLSYDQQIIIKRAEIGVGACYTYDRSLASNFPKQSINLSFASALSVSERSGLGLGIQVGYNNMFISYDHLSFPEQYNRDTGGFDTSLPISENFDENNSDYVNVNAGLVWSYKMSKSYLSTGISVRHLNSPSYHLTDIKSSISQRYIYHVVYKNYANNQFHFTPRFLFSHQSSINYFMVGSSMQVNKDFGLDSAKGYFFGAYYAFREEIDANSLIAVLGFEKRMFTAMLTGDFNINKKVGNVHNQAFEITFIIRRPALVLRKTIVPWVSH